MKKGKIKLGEVRVSSFVTKNTLEKVKGGATRDYYTYSAPGAAFCDCAKVPYC